MNDEPGPVTRDYGNRFRKVFALTVVVILVTSVVSIFHAYAGCLVFFILMALGLIAIIFPTRERGASRGNVTMRERPARARRNVISGEEPKEGGRSDVAGGAGSGARGRSRTRGKRSGRGGGRRRALRCPECGSTRLVYEAGYMIGQVYLCKDCEYRGSFVIEFDPVSIEDGGVGKGLHESGSGEEEGMEEEILGDGDQGDPHDASAPEEKLPEPPGLEDILRDMDAKEREDED